MADVCLARAYGAYDTAAFVVVQLAIVVIARNGILMADVLADSLKFYLATIFHSPDNQHFTDGMRVIIRQADTGISLMVWYPEKYPQIPGCQKNNSGDIGQ